MTASSGTSAPTSASARDRPSPWILGSWQDLLLFVGTPALILPAFWITKTQLSIAQISLYVAAFGALGHHLPGMMRAYGDRDLFRRFRVRFVVAPVLIVAASAYCAREGLTVLALVAVVWGVWHGLMQTYGFVRIYDGKSSGFSSLTRHLDLAMCIAWFTSGMMVSPDRFFSLLEKYHVYCGGPLPSAGTVSMFANAWFWATWALTAVYIGHLIGEWFRGRAPNPIKLLLMATSFGFWWFTRVTVDNPLVGIALFEVFHDVQYLSIVWVFNRGRSAKDPGAGPFTRFLFRRSGALIGVYVGMVFCYGALGLIPRAGFSMAEVTTAFQGVLVASGLLHFYYDGFIWKLREKAIRDPMGLSETGGTRRVQTLPMWARHSTKWAVFLIPAAILGFRETKLTDTRVDRFAFLTQAVPDSADAREAYASDLARLGRLDEAVDQFGQAIAIARDFVEARNNLGIVLAQQGLTDEAILQFRGALEFDPQHVDALTNLGLGLARTGRIEEAIGLYEQALDIDPYHAIARENLELARRPRADDAVSEINDHAVRLAMTGRVNEAIEALESALRLDPTSAALHNNLGILLAGAGRFEEAKGHYEAVLRVQPESLETQVNLLGLLLTVEARDEADRCLESLLRLGGDSAELRSKIGVVFATRGMMDQAVVQFREAVRIDPEFAEAVGNLNRATQALKEKPRPDPRP